MRLAEGESRRIVSPIERPGKLTVQPHINARQAFVRLDGALAVADAAARALARARTPRRRDRRHPGSGLAGPAAGEHRDPQRERVDPDFRPRRPEPAAARREADPAELSRSRPTDSPLLESRRCPPRCARRRFSCSPLLALLLFVLRRRRTRSLRRLAERSARVRRAGQRGSPRHTAPETTRRSEPCRRLPRRRRPATDPLAVREREAEQAFTDGDLARALGLYRELAAQHPEAAERSRLRVTAAWLVFQLGNPEAARLELTATLMRDPAFQPRAEIYSPEFMALFLNAQRDAAEERTRSAARLLKQGIDALTAGDSADGAAAGSRRAWRSRRARCAPSSPWRRSTSRSAGLTPLWRASSASWRSSAARRRSCRASSRRRC